MRRRIRRLWSFILVFAIVLSYPSVIFASGENPEASVTNVEVESRAGKASPASILVFHDVSKSAWYYSPVNYVNSEKLMTGLDAGTFGPGRTLARAQFAVILYRMAGTPAADAPAVFPDVSADSWYANAVSWANDNGIIKGYKSNGRFGPNDNITREQIALMFYRYANKMGYDTAKMKEISEFPDAKDVKGTENVNAMSWAVGTNIIKGSKGRLNPGDNANRAECAMMVMRFMKEYDPKFAMPEEYLHKVNTYANQFVDVSRDAWYANAVKISYEYGMMSGKKKTEFCPMETMSVAEVVTIASRLHNLYHGGDGVFPSGNPWYQSYLDYAVKNGIIKGNMNTNYMAPATRQEAAVLISNALPNYILPRINPLSAGGILDVSYVPGMLGEIALKNAGILEANDHYTTDADMALEDPDIVYWVVSTNAKAASTKEEYDAIYQLYEAGVMTGVDDYGRFEPLSNINRASMAAVISRVLEPSMRVTPHLKKIVKRLVPMNQLANLSSLREKLSDYELAQAYEVARTIVEPLVGLPIEEQMFAITIALRAFFEKYMMYSETQPHYSDPYGYLILRAASCAGCTRTTGMCLNMLGIPYEHINPNQWTHQWARVNVNGRYWICDPFFLYCGMEEIPYKHPALY